MFKFIVVLLLSLILLALVSQPGNTTVREVSEIAQKVKKAGNEAWKELSK